MADLIERIPDGYTEGPWLHDAVDHIIAPDNQDVALVGRFADDTENADANAALIALAPELAAGYRAQASRIAKLEAEVVQLRTALRKVAASRAALAATNTGGADDAR